MKFITIADCASCSSTVDMCYLCIKIASGLSICELLVTEYFCCCHLILLSLNISIEAMLNCCTASDLPLVLYYCFLPMRVTEYFSRLHQLNIVHLCIQIVNWTEHLNVSLCSMLILVLIHFRDADLVLTEWNSVIGHYSVIGHIVSLKIMHFWYAAAWIMAPGEQVPSAWIRAEVLNINLKKIFYFFNA